MSLKSIVSASYTKQSAFTGLGNFNEIAQDSDNIFKSAKPDDLQPFYVPSAQYAQPKTTILNENGFV